ncbi:MAG: hypothetical protein HW385_1446 [candidate division NC10 bacterium]|nr:hypothetical protein [candidate division NC10 bacterium]
MRTTHFSVDRLREVFRSQLVLTLSEMMKALGTAVKMTVFRKLRELNYRASYSHAGKYYTLDELGRWNVDGLWAYQGIRFSRHGTLLATLQHMIDTGPSGCFAEELERRVFVRVHNTLSTLHRRGQVIRHQIGGAFLYVCVSGGDRQLLRRRRAEAERVSEAPRPEGFASPQVADSLRVFLTTLNEKQRRLYAGFESLKLGHGGDAAIAEITGLNVKTVARGRKELLAGDIHPDRIRAPGAGRPSVKKNRDSQGTGAPAGG